MKQLQPIGWSLLLSILVVMLYHYGWQPTERVIIQEQQPNAQWVREYSDRYWDALPSAPVHIEPDSANLQPRRGFQQAAAKAASAVVYIKTKTTDRSEDWGDTYSSSNGSGVIISPDGYIVTNQHVIDQGNSISVILNDRRELNAEVIGIDESTDLALLRVESPPLPYLSFGDSDLLSVGEWVLAAGTPFRLQSTVTAGIVSAKARSIEVLEDPSGIESFIQTDAAVNPGNSGGALVNTDGELVGITTAILTFSGRSEGYSFAIPSNLVKKVISDLREFGTVHRGMMGIEARSVDFELSQELGLKEVRGVYIYRVNPSSAADEAGLKPGDIILSINEKTINTLPDLMEKLGQYRPGDSLDLECWRGPKKIQTKILLRNQFNTTDLVNIRSEGVLNELGLEIRDLIRSEKETIEEGGVKVVSVYRGSIVERTKMDPGFIITHINDQPVTKASSLIEQLESQEGRIVLQGVYEKYEGPFWYVFNK